MFTVTVRLRSGRSGVTVAWGRVVLPVALAALLVVIGRRPCKGTGVLTSAIRNWDAKGASNAAQRPRRG